MATGISEAVTAAARPATRPDTTESRWRHPLVLRLLSVVAVCVAWEWGGWYPISPSFPPFSATMAATWEMLVSGELGRAFWITLQPLALGLVISALAGIGAGVAMGLNRLVEWLGAPVFIVLQSAPLAALVPMLTLVYGIGLTSKVLVVCIMAMPVIVLNSYNAVRHTPVSLIEMGRVFQASQRQLILGVILPSASPVIFAGLRLGAAAGFIGAILAELLITPTGIGDIITYNQSIADYAKMYSAILSVIVFSVLFIELLERIEVTVFRPERRGR